MSLFDEAVFVSRYIEQASKKYS